MLRMTAKEYQELLRQQAMKKPGNKHHNKIVYIYADGLVSEYKGLSGHGDIVRRYDSKKEYNRHKELELLERSGKISNLRWQVPILLQDGVTDAAGKKIRPIFYTADFTYVENGMDIVEDVKGIDRIDGKPRTTEAFRLKWKLLAARYPDRIFRIF